MTINPNLQTLLHDLAQHMGLSDLALDGEGFTALRFDDQLVVNLQYVADAEALLFYTDLGPAASGPQLYPLLLRANLFWRSTLGATLSLSGDNPAHVVLAREIPWQGMSLDSLVGLLDAFVATAEDWQAVVQSEAEDVSPEQNPDIPPAGDLGMIRV